MGMGIPKGMGIRFSLWDSHMDIPVGIPELPWVWEWGRNSTPTATLVDTEISLFFEIKETVIKSHY